MNRRISPVSDDWAVKGCHAHFGRTEFAIRPDHLGGFVCRKVFSSTTDEELLEAEKAFELSMRDRDWRRKLREAVARGMKRLQGCAGVTPWERMNGRLRELRMLLVALERREPDE